jgi:hypothetical protein
MKLPANIGRSSDRRTMSVFGPSRLLATSRTTSANSAARFSLEVLDAAQSSGRVMDEVIAAAGGGASRPKKFR